MMKTSILGDSIATIMAPSPFMFTGSRKVQWVAMDDDDQFCGSMSTTTSSSSSSSFDDSTSVTSSSMASTSSSDLAEDASSNYGPLYELSDLLAHLPIKRGLSKHFDGKSQSFTSLSSVRSIEDLAKKRNKMMKTCKSYGGGLNIHNKTISKNKKSPKGKRSPSRPLIPQSVGTIELNLSNLHIQS